MNELPLSGVIVVDLSRALAGPHATMMLGDMGARVIKVEAEGTGDDSRGWGPPFVGAAEEKESTYFLSCNRNKESIELNLKDPPDLHLLKALIARADVLVENFRPGVMDRLGLTAAELEAVNPELVILSISGFGTRGPDSGRAGYDQILQGEAGLMSITGPDSEHPQKVGVPIGDLLAGIYGAFGVAAGLTRRAKTGRGGVVRTSLLRSLVSSHTFQGTRWTVAGEVPTALGNQHPSISPYGLFRCADGAVQMSVGNQSLWTSFATEFGIDPGQERFADNGARVMHRSELIEAIETVFAKVPRAELLSRLIRIGVPAGQIRSIDEVYEWDQVLAEGLVIETDHSTLGRIKLPGASVVFDGCTLPVSQPPPVLGEHSEAIRAWLAVKNEITEI